MGYSPWGRELTPLNTRIRRHKERRRERQRNREKGGRKKERKEKVRKEGKERSFVLLRQ